MADLRIGFGHDLHRLKDGGRLMLGGLVAAEGLSAVAHSDGDVVLHALVDALLGAIGGGDIGTLFPDTDDRYRGADSMHFLDEALRLVREAGWAVANADVLVSAERPKLGPLKAEMARRLSERLGGPCNVKAGTNEGCDAVGRGEAIAATAVVLLVRR